MTKQAVKRQRFTKSDLLTIKVGKDDCAKEFMAHKSCLTKTSGFFRAAMNRYWREGQESNVTIPDHEPDAFDGYLAWVYSKEIKLEKDKCSHCAKQGNDDCNTTRSLSLAKMYVLGDYLGDKRFCNAVIDLIKRSGAESDCYLPVETVQYVWQTVPSDCPLRDLMLEIWKVDLQYSDRCNLPRECPVDFFVDLLVDVGKLLAVDGYSKSQLEDETSFHMKVDG